MWRYFARVFRAKYLYHKTLWYLSIVYRTPPISPLLSGATRKFTNLQEERLVLTNKKPNCPPIGRRTSQRFVLEWGTAQQQDSWSFAKVPTHCAHLSLTEHTELFHWAVTSGSLLLVHKPYYRRIAIRKGLILCAQPKANQKQGSVSLRTNKMTAQLVTPELDLELRVYMTTQIRVETRLHVLLIMAITH